MFVQVGTNRATNSALSTVAHFYYNRYKILVMQTHTVSFSRYLSVIFSSSSKNANISGILSSLFGDALFELSKSEKSNDKTEPTD